MSTDQHELPLLLRRAYRAELAALEKLAGPGKGVAALGAHVARQLTLADEIDRQLAETQAAHAGARGERERRAVIERALQAWQAAPVADRALRAARRGELDLDALGERAAIAVGACHAQVFLALQLMAARAPAHELASTVATCVHLLASAAGDPVACGAAEALALLLGRADAAAFVPAGAWDALEHMLASGAGSRRTQAALACAALRADPARALPVLRARLLSPLGDPDDFLLRQHFVVQLMAAGRNEERLALLLALATRSDPSEHVRISLPAALCAAGAARALPALRAMLAPAPEGDSSHRVRASAGLALLALAESGVSEAFDGLELLLQGDARVTRISAEELAQLARRAALPIPVARTLAQAAARAAGAAPDADTAEPLLRLVESLAPVVDARLAQAARELEPAIEALPRQHSVRVVSSLEPGVVGRTLARLARGNFGLYAEPVAGGYRITHGAARVRRLWRVLHELRTPTPYKRQDQLHSIGRRFSGSLRAHSEQLGEATPTIPGEPLALTPAGSWGTHLPTVDDLLSVPLLGTGSFELFSARAVCRVQMPVGPLARARTLLQLSRDYVELAADRNRALLPADASDFGRYRERLARLGIQLELEAYPQGPAPAAPIIHSVARNFSPAKGELWSWSALALQAGLQDLLADALRYLLTPSENTLGELAAATTLLGAGLLAKNLAQRQRIAADRDAIPLVIGGWGTRGKSGTERLKAAMLHGQGLRVLVKTTGCEAMFIHGVPGRKPTEIFIHRAYDKATIWEQRDVLRLAAKLDVQVFLWECMALSPPLVETLQEQWMRDDLSTLTNAYPDHEDIQGPSGNDVANVIAGFMRRGGTTLTTEEQMLPIFEEQARHKAARLVVVPRRDHELLADDLLARFPYNEHPRNIALVRQLARELGLDADLATADMADHVVADLGVLKAYRSAEHRGRQITFVNGMSANERTGFLSNWQRMQCERAVEASVERGQWTVTVVNNRYDRVARSKVFAEILVRDASAERHLLIGTNLVGLRRYVEQALGRLLDELQLFRLGEGPSVRGPRCERMRQRLRIGPASAPAVLAELSAWTGLQTESLHAVAADALAQAAHSADAGSSLAALIAQLEASSFGHAVRELVRDELQVERAAFVARSVARRALLSSLERAAEAVTGDDARGAAQAVNARQRRVYRELFMEMLVALPNPAASGDEVIDFIVSALPPGVNATLMGTQNIKGTGLDMVYRFLRHDEVGQLVDRLAQANAASARQIVSQLATRSDWGMLDTRLAMTALASARERFAAEPALLDALANLGSQLAERSQRSAAVGPVLAGPKRIVGAALDSFDAVRRRWRAERLLDALVHQEISHERAALEARRLVDREKKGWL